MKRKVRVFLDTNVLLVPGNVHVDVFSEIKRIMDSSFEFVVVDHVKEELEKMARQSNAKESRSARLALQFIEQKPLKSAQSSKAGYADDAIIELLSAGDVVATLDKELKRRARAKGARIATLKQKKYMIFEDE